MARSSLERWTLTDAAEMYSVREWANEYFDINEAGEVRVCPSGEPGGPAVSLMQIVRELGVRGVAMPVLLRFGDVLEARVRSINEGFRRAMTTAGYKGDFRGVYPIKVNQQQHVIEEIASFGRKYHHGFEVGSKAELIAALAYVDDPEAYVICNGYKDEEFMELALYGRKLGLRVVIVMEMVQELPLILRTAERLAVEPLIGVRVKLSQRAGGHWNDSGGDRSFFGLTTAETIAVVDELKRLGKLPWLQLLHYHLGSQIPNIRAIRAGLREACRFYVGLAREGAPMGLFDVGGGLAVDYDGSHTNFSSSRNYSLDEYCVDIIEETMEILDEAGVAHPTIISESGRATVAYHSVLLFNVLDANRFERPAPTTLPEGAHEMLVKLWEAARNLNRKNAQESFHDANFYRDELRTLFMHGQISLRDRAFGEEIHWSVVTRIARMIEEDKYVPDEMEGIEEALADVYYGNFSVFQSLPDSWAIEQLFPVMPIHRLDEQPTRYCTLADITCDCDGKIDRFIDLHDVKRTLPVHVLKEDEDYVLGVFLVGAYQETLGDLHNLFGDTNVVGVRVNGDGQIEFTKEIEGDTVADVLSYVEYEPKELVNRVRLTAERAVREKRISPRERRMIMDAYEAGMRGYTYFER